MKKYLFLFLLILLIATISFTLTMKENDAPEEAIKNLYDAIDAAKQKGDYNCCIEPACTMCYLGHWKFEKGTCHCDEAIKDGRNEDVCPECVNGLEKGLCTSTIEEECKLDQEIFG